MEDSDRPRVELFVRTLAPTGAMGRQEAVVERLLALERRGGIAAVELTVWGSAVTLDSSCASVGSGVAVARRVRRFRRWARDRDVSLEPALATRTVDSSITGESYERVSLPRLCLAVYEGADLLAVYPHRRGDETRSLGDGIAALEAAADTPSTRDLASVGVSDAEKRREVERDGDGLWQEEAD